MAAPPPPLKSAKDSLVAASSEDSSHDTLNTGQEIPKKAGFISLRIRRGGNSIRPSRLCVPSFADDQAKQKQGSPCLCGMAEAGLFADDYTLSRRPVFGTHQVFTVGSRFLVARILLHYLAEIG